MKTNKPSWQQQLSEAITDPKHLCKVPGLSQWQPALDYIACDSSVTEVILSGGDPLILKDSQLSNFIASLEKIPHLRCLRIHTRLPIVIPDRVTKNLVSLLKETSLKIVFVLHCNHANEIDGCVEEAVSKLEGAVLLNQSVLLKGINDNEGALINLSRRLFELNVLPYYLHLLDPVEGAAHFDVPEEKARHLLREAANQLPGYLVPKLVREIPGALSKQPL